jgi:ABC-type dipeptide/oligopeptide/nickel transport system permease subunit
MSSKRRAGTVSVALRTPTGAAAAVLLLALLVLAVIGPLVWGDKAKAVDVAHILQPGTSAHPLGTDNLGRDMAWRVAAGTGISLLIGVVVTAASMAVGLILGAVAGYFRGPADQIISGLIDLTWGFPVILVAVIFVRFLAAGAG